MRGGLTEDAKSRCPKCNKEADMEDVKRQVEWWGTSKEIGGLVMGKLLEHSSLYVDEKSDGE